MKFAEDGRTTAYTINEYDILRAQRDALAAALRDVYDRTLAPTENSPAIRMIREAARAALAALETK